MRESSSSEEIASARISCSVSWSKDLGTGVPFDVGERLHTTPTSLRPPCARRRTCGRVWHMDVTDFQRDVIERSRSIPVLVDFWAAWCGPCRVLGPILERLASQASGRWELAKVDTEAHPDVSAEYGVMGIPSVKLFVDGAVVDEFVGALPERDVRRWLERALPAPQSAELEAAAAALKRGAWEEAKLEVENVLAYAPDDPRARMLLEEGLLHIDTAAAAGSGEGRV